VPIDAQELKRCGAAAWRTIQSLMRTADKGVNDPKRRASEDWRAWRSGNARVLPVFRSRNIAGGRRENSAQA
jgi:hypothetical protein